MRNLRHELVHPAIPSSADIGRESKLATPRLDAEARRTPSGIAAMACDHPNLDSTNETVTATTAGRRLVQSQSEARSMTRANFRWASEAVTDVSLPVQACRSHGRAGSAMVDETCLRCCTGISSATTRALLCAGSGSASAGSRCPNTDRWANAPAPREHGPGTATGVAVFRRVSGQR